jgi:hypothetical protein
MWHYINLCIEGLAGETMINQSFSVNFNEARN